MNPDGSVNLVDESLYGVGGKLYATFDEFSVGTDGFTINPSPSDPSISPGLYQIDPTTGVATLIAPTGEHILSTVEVGGTLYAFEGTISAATPIFPGPPLIQLMTLDLTNGNTSLVADLNPDVPIYGASPVPPVPEPGSFALVGTGLVALASRLRRRPS
jgi:hypothetical protein